MKTFKSFAVSTFAAASTLMFVALSTPAQACTNCTIRVNGPVFNGPVLNGPVLNGPVLNGPVLNGPVLNGPVLQGPVLQGPVLQGPVLNGPVLNGPTVQGPQFQAPLPKSATTAATRPAKFLAVTLPNGQTLPLH